MISQVLSSPVGEREEEEEEVRVRKGGGCYGEMMEVKRLNGNVKKEKRKDERKKMWEGGKYERNEGKNRDS